ncbi:MAG: ATP-binding protein [Deltaproteobacteria bacterium]|nr:ATP-binding protein [Deltaproteobacteria bacterium]
MSNSERIFRTLQTPSDIQRLAASESESQFLDYKRSKHGDEKRWRRSIAKAVCAFANAEGGVVVVGVNDSTRALEPFAVGLQLEEEVQRAIVTAVQPYPSRIEVKSLGSPNGYLVIHSPRSFEAPHAFHNPDKKGGLWYPQRRGESSEAMRHGELADMFGRRLLPEFRLEGLGRLIEDSSPRLLFLLRLRNSGGASAQQPAVVFDGESSSGSGLCGSLIPATDGGSIWERARSASDQRKMIRSVVGTFLHPGQVEDLARWEFSEKGPWQPPWTLFCDIYSGNNAAARCTLKISESLVMRVRAADGSSVSIPSND